MGLKALDDCYFFEEKKTQGKSNIKEWLCTKYSYQYQVFIYLEGYFEKIK